MKVLYPFLMLLSKAKVKYKVEVAGNCRNPSNKPVIYAANHSAFQDMPIALHVIGKHAYIMAGKQNLNFLDKLFFVLNGTIWIDRKNGKSRRASKETAIKYLKKGRALLWFPEATWNLTANLLMLPMRWGIIEVAYKTGAHIIPMALEYDKTKMICRVKFGEPLEEILPDMRQGIQMLRDKMATLRWELMCENTIISRMNTNIEELQKEVENAIAEYPSIDWEYEVSCIYQNEI